MGKLRTLLGLRSLKQLLLDRTWFRRAWTFQETVMARKATVHCRKFAQDWELVYAACQCLLSKMISLGGELNREEVVFAVKDVIKKGDLRRDWSRMYLLANPGIGDPIDQQEAKAWIDSNPAALENVLAQMRLESLLPEIRPTGATDPRDKVLALLGIAHDSGRRFPFPGYMSPVGDLYTAVVRFWLNRPGATPDISFLSQVHESNAEHHLPSWVPDWSCPLTATPIAELGPFRAAGDARAIGSILDASVPLTLRVRGFLVLTVQAIDKNLRNIDRHAEMIGLFDNPYPTTSISYPDVYRCAADPSQPEDFQLPDRAPTDPGFWDYLRQRAQQASEEGTPGREGQQGQHSSADLRAKLLPIHMQGFRQFNESTKMPAIGRAFFVSAEGFMGLAPRDTRAGDQIYIFLGANIPFAVRKREDMTFTFLGECYVFGLMHGEAARDCPADRLEDVLLV